jgi:hypothetical protein
MGNLPETCDRDSKFALGSSINIIQIIMASLAVLCDPGFSSLNIIPPEYLPKIVWAAGAITFILRFTSGGKAITFDPRAPWR